MTNFWRIVGIGLGFVFLAFLISTQMVSGGQDNLSQDNLNNAVRAALVSSRDNSARTNAGTFVVDKQKFNQTLGNMAIKQYGNKKIEYSRDFKIDYLQDKESGIQSNPSSNYEPIKAVSVKVNLDPNMKKQTTNKQNTHVFTNVIQTSQPSNTTGGNSDSSNDLTR